MNERNKRLWDEAIENIGDRYINETAETLKKHSGKEIIFTEIIVEKPAEYKSDKLRRALAVAFSSAAALAVVIGAGFILRSAAPLEQNPAGTVTEPTGADTTGITTSVEASKLPDTTTVSYSIDATTTAPVELSAILYSFADFGKYCVQLNSDSEYITLQTVADGQILCEYDTGIAVETIGEISAEIAGYKFSRDITALFVPYRDEGNGGISYNARLYYCTADSITPLTVEYDPFDPDTPMFRTEHVISSLLTYQLNIDAATNSFFIETDPNGQREYFLIDFENLTVTHKNLFPLDTSDEVISGRIMDFDTNSDIFETIFYGSWQSQYGDRNEILKYTYYSDSGYHYYCGLIAEDESGYYMQTDYYGGEAVLYVAKDNTDYMYIYIGSLGDNTVRSSYNGVFKRTDKPEDYGGKDLTIAGELSQRGIMKLYELTGFSADNLTPRSITADDGSVWLNSLGMYIKSITDNEICFSVPYYLDKEGTELIGVESTIRLFYLTAERNGDEWAITSTSMYDPQLETPEGNPTEYVKEVQELTARVNANILESGAGAPSNFAITVDYYPTSDGHYYAHRRLGNDMALNLDYNEYYYYDGTGYRYLGSTRGYHQPFLHDDKFYFTVKEIMQDDNSNITMPHIVKFNNNDAVLYETLPIDADAYYHYVNVEEVGDYNLITVELGYTDKYYILEGPAPYDTILLTEDKIIIDEDRKGFTAIITDEVTGEEEEVRCRPDSDSLSDVIWALGKNSDYIISKCFFSGSGPDYSDTITAADGTTLGYLCDVTDLYEFLNTTFTADTAYDLVENSPMKFTAYDNKLYCGHYNYQGDLQIGKNTYEIISETDTEAEIRCTSYLWDTETGALTDEVGFTAIIKAVRTEKGWKFDGYYNPYEA